MQRIISTAFLLIWSITLVAAAATQKKPHMLAPGEVGLALALALLLALAKRFPLRVARRTRILLDVGLIFTTALVFPAPWSVLVAGSGTLIGMALNRRELPHIAIDFAVVVVEVFSAQSVYVQLGGAIPFQFESRLIVVPLIGAITTMLAVDRLLTSALLQYGPYSVWRWFKSRQQPLTLHVALLLSGVYLALLLQTHPWSIMLIVPSITLVYLSLQASLRKALGSMTLEAVETLADLIDRRDSYTAGHSARVAELAERLAVEMGLPRDEVETIRAAGRVHDLGKMEIDTCILTKPGRLTDDEWEFIRHHPIAGAEILSRFAGFASGAKYVRHHHERWDGRGYPDGLRGEEIPIGARIIAVADAFDAMTSDRHYRKALSLDLVVEEFKRGAGTQWSEDVVAALFRILRQENTNLGEVGVLRVAVA